MLERPLETGWLPDTPEDDNLLRRFTISQAAVNDVTAVRGRRARTAAVALADSGGPVPYYNQAILLRPLTGADDPVLDDIADFFDGIGRPWTVLSVWPTPDLSARGLHLSGHPAFVARPPSSVDHRPPADVAVELVADPAELAVAEQVVIDGYPLDEARGQPVGAVFPPELLATDLHVRLARLAGEPAGVGAVRVGHGVVNLCLGATLPIARRRGVWESLVWARAAEAPDLPVVAFTSDYSRPGFVRMGFLVVTRFTLWMG